MEESLMEGAVRFLLMAGVWGCHFVPHHKKAPAERGGDMTHTFIFCLFFRLLGVVKWLRCGGKCIVFSRRLWIVWCFPGRAPGANAYMIHEERLC